nr:MAG TPA: hypothetical protein [Caudoviricetes sp.]
MIYYKLHKLHTNLNPVKYLYINVSKLSISFT